MNAALNVFHNSDILDSSQTKSISSVCIASTPQAVQSIYSVFIQKLTGLEEIRAPYEVIKGYENDLDLLKRINFSGDIDEVMSVMCTPSSTTTATKHYIIQVITDHPEQNSFRFNVKNNEDIRTYDQTALLELIDVSSIKGEVFHVSCAREIEIN